MKTSVLVVGAGAAGMLAAGFAGAGGADTVLLERNDRPGRKVMITGKGRCNVTNDRRSVQELIANVPRNGRFLYGAFSRFMPEDVMEFFESRGVELKVERGGRVFPVSDKASDIVDALAAFAGRYSTIVKGRAVKLMLDGGEVSGVETEGGDKIYADKVIIATGGLSYPATGSTGDGYELARQAGHKVVPAVPSLVPLEIHEGFCSRLMGLSLRNVALKVLDTDKGGKEIYKDFGEMLFTHFGVSGPMVLSASAHMRDMKRGRYKIVIDLKPALTPEQLDARILRDFSENTNRNFINALNSLLPKKLVPVIVSLSGISPSEKVNQVTKEQRRRLAELLKGLTVTVTGFRPIAEAIVTSGGVEVSSIDPKTMESKLVPGLYFAGEVIDADAYTGGYNLQIAFSTGRLAGISAAQSISDKTGGLTMNNNIINVAIDGPAGAGKSTVARGAAKQLGYIYVDTGALYRAIGVNALRNGVDTKDKAAVAASLDGVKVNLVFENGEQKVMLNGEDVSVEIRTPEASMAASDVSAVPEVRAFLFDLQRDIAKRNSCIMDGRDIGTVVLPQAQVKIFLTASPEIRAERRYKELIEKGSEVDYQSVLDDIVKRDYNDSHREIAPLKPAEDSVLFDTTGLALDESVAAITKIIKEKI